MFAATFAAVATLEMILLRKDHKTLLIVVVILFF